METYLNRIYDDICSQIFIYLDINDIKNLLNIYPCFNSIVNVKLNWINKFKYENKEKYIKYMLRSNDVITFYEFINNIYSEIKKYRDVIELSFEHAILTFPINKTLSNPEGQNGLDLDDMTEICNMIQADVNLNHKIKEISHIIKDDTVVYLIDLYITRDHATCYDRYKILSGEMQCSNYDRLFELLILNDLINKNSLSAY